MVGQSVPSAYVGRFAPSPTGPLHFGSLVAAVGSYLDAHAQGGRWLLRIEDVDRPRSVPGAEDAILSLLGDYGFTWDGPVLRQSERSPIYRERLESLRKLGLAYPCGCSRREIADSQVNLHGGGEMRYPGTCRNGLPAGRQGRAWRLRVEPGQVCFLDGLQGAQQQDVAALSGDFVLQRADGLYAYQLAVVVDDACQGVTHVVRGADLLDSTPRQILLQRALGLPALRYTHLPLATHPHGEKLSKQTLARPLLGLPKGAVLAHALAFLGQAVPPRAEEWPLAELWAWAIAHWALGRVPRQKALPAPALPAEQ